MERLGEDDIIAQARSNFGELTEGIANPGLLLAALEAFYMNGSADDVSGDADTFGHFYRVHRWIVWTDSQGFKNIDTHDTEAEALAAYGHHERAYVEVSDAADQGYI